MGKGFIKVHREIQDHWLWRIREPFDKRSAFLDLLLLANYAECKELYRGKLVCRERGQVACSKAWLADRWGWSREKVTGFLKALEADGMATTVATTQATTITIENYSKWQGDPTTQATTHRQRNGSAPTTHRQRTDTQKKEKERKERVRNKEEAAGDEYMDNLAEMRRRRDAALERLNNEQSNSDWPAN